MRKNNILLLILLLVSCCSKEMKESSNEVLYYKNGQIKHQIPLSNGQRNGLATSYYESGAIMAKSNWKDGQLDGQKIFYHENGKIQQVGQYRDGIPFRVEDYTDVGYLRQVTVYDSAGRVFDYYTYKRDGTRDFSFETKDPIFIVKKDTVSVGENYIAMIRLGNRQYSHVDVFIGNPKDPQIIKKNAPLPKKDSLTSILTIKADSAGPSEVSGVVFERSLKWDSLHVTPFTHRFYITPRKGEKSI